MQQILDMAGLTWANVSALMRRAAGSHGSSGVGELKGQVLAPRESGEPAGAAARASSGARETPIVEDDAMDEEENSEGDESSDNDEAYTESSGVCRLGNAFEADDLQERSTTRRGKGRGKGRAGRAGGRFSRRVLPAAPLMEGGGRQASSRMDAQAVKATGLIKCGMEQLLNLSKDNWSELVTEGNVNAIKKELDRYATIFAHKDPDIHASINDCNFYSSLVPFMGAWRLHRGMLPDDVLSGQYQNLDALQTALQTHCSGVWELAPGLAMLHMQAGFLHTVDTKGIPEGLAMLDMEHARSIVRRQSTLFRQGASSDEVVNTR